MRKQTELPEFQWEGKHYTIPEPAYHGNTSLIRLPDGTILSIKGWLEGVPPSPKVELVSFNLVCEATEV